MDNTAQRTTTLADRLGTGIDGLDYLLSGGFPRNSLILVGGRPGAGKTLLASHFLYSGLLYGEQGIYVSFAETKDQFLKIMENFGLRFQRFIDEGKFQYLDLTTVSAEAVADALDLILAAVVTLGAKRLVIDSYDALALGFTNLADARIALHAVLGKAVKHEGCTTLILSEMPYGKVDVGLGVEEFVADGIILMDIVKEREGPRRVISIRKMRGVEISLRPSSYEISKSGLSVFPALQPTGRRGMTERRLPTGVPGLDALTEGGFLEGSVTGIIGAAGVGKTTFAIQFVCYGARSSKENGLLLSFSEPENQIRLVAKRLGFDDIETLEKQGKLSIAFILPEQYTPEGLIIKIQKLLEQVQPRRVVIDDVGALRQIVKDDENDEFVRTVAHLCQESGATLILTFTASELAGNTITGSTSMDNIILLRYVEVSGKMDRSMILLKMRGTRHDNSIRKFEIGQGGINLGNTYEDFVGVLSGTAMRASRQFQKEEGRIAQSEAKARGKRRKKFDAKLRKS
jgi:circadian clock protein KaiC